jgi:hypothetical protein
VIRELTGSLVEDPRISLIVRIDEVGSVAACQSGGDARENLVAIACSQAELQAFEMKAFKGEGVDHVRRISVAFSAKG